MPVTPSPLRKSPKSRSTPRPTPTNNNVGARRSGLHETTSVQDRIRQWQAHGAAIAPAPDTVSIRSPPASDHIRTPESSRPSSPNHHASDTSPRVKNTRRMSNIDREQIEDGGRKGSAKRRSTGGKRHTVTGEGKSASTPKAQIKPTNEPTTVASRFMERDSTQRDRNYNSSRAEREERRRRRRDARSQTGSVTNGVASSVRSYPRSDSRPGSGLADTYLPNRGQDNITDDMSTIPVSPRLSDFPPTEEHHPVDDEKGVFHSRSKYAETLGRAPQYTQEEEGPKSKKRDLISKTKGIITGRNDPPLPMTNRIPSIEAWLEEQPDPFVEGGERKVQTEMERPKTKRRAKKREVSIDATILEDPNKIWESVSVNQDNETNITEKKEIQSKSKTRRKSPATVSQHESNDRRKFSFEADDIPGQEDTPSKLQDSLDHESSPTTLRRSAVRPTKNRIPRSNPRLSTADSSNSNAVKTSSVSPSVIQPKFQELQLKGLPPLPVVEVADLIPHDNNPHQGQNSGLKRKLTTHEDLISVLSQPRLSPKSVRTRKNTRKARAEPNIDIVQSILANIKIDEYKYLRELRTLVDGVTPVLLQSVLSKTDSISAAGLFSTSDHKVDDLDLTRPIIDMGIALERLKSLHMRIPLHSVDNLLPWAQTAHKAYTDYIKAWRLGFQDVIVNLAPLSNDQSDIDGVMDRDLEGDIVDMNGKKVDVAYLQKRPLIRIKRLAKDFACLQLEYSHHPLASKIAQDFAELTDLAKRRHREEQGRLEDQAAADIDVTRVRNVQTMAPMTEVTIKKNRRVRARDTFNMTLYHSTGQRMDCKVELVLRDEQPNQSVGGDVLICEMDDVGKWLLFAPVELSKLSARKGESGCDLVIMIRGQVGLGQEWHELMAMKADDPEAAVEWMNMLGSNPLPPKLSRVPSFWDLRRSAEQATVESVQVLNPPKLTQSILATVPSDMEVPVGEPSIAGTRRSKGQALPKKALFERAIPKLSLGGGLQKKTLPEHYQSIQLPTPNKSLPPSIHSSDRSVISDSSSKAALRLQIAPNVSTSFNESRDSQSSDTRQQAYSPQRAYATPTSQESTPTHSKQRLLRTDNVSREWMQTPFQSNTPQPTENSIQDDYYRTSSFDKSPEASRATSSAPSQLLPKVAKIRAPSVTGSASSTPLNETIREQWSSVAGQHKQPTQPLRHSYSELEPSTTTLVDDGPPTPVYTARNSLPILSKPRLEQQSLPNNQIEIQTRPKDIPSNQSPTSYKQDKFRSPVSSSPLKHQYEPSDSEYDTISADSESCYSSSDTSEDVGSELYDQATPLVELKTGGGRIVRTQQKPPLKTIPSTGSRTLAPSDSASQGPYRQVPRPSAFPADRKSRTIAVICSWSDRGLWEPLQDDECSIVVSPGLIQAFPMSAAHSHPMSGPDWLGPETERVDMPIVEFELTPIVPLRKGTALDITIRSPPTANSQIRTTNNVMFRSRSIMECENLYNMINWARCNNPTYIALLRSRPREESVSFAANVGQLRTKSWLKFGSKEKTSYRASSVPPLSIGESNASAGTMTSAMSALRRFGKNSPFSLNRSSVVRKAGRGTDNSLYSSSSGTGPGSGSSTPAPSQAGFIPGLEGPNVPASSAEAANGGGMVNNMKIRLFIRRGQSWEALGASQLTVLPAVISNDSRPESADAVTPESPTPVRQVSATGQPRQFRLSSSSHTPHRIHGNGKEKRVLITKFRRPDVVLLDATLGESCFEKVMQTGIAVSVWKEDDEVQRFGGVLTGKQTMYMIQFPTSAEASWVFNMCGTYRYGVGA